MSRVGHNFPATPDTHHKLACISWPEPYIYTVYDRIYGDFPAKNTVYTPYIYGSGQPYACMNDFANPYSCAQAHSEWHGSGAFLPRHVTHSRLKR